MSLVGNLAVGAVGVLTGLLAARILGPTGRGRLAAIQLWPTTLASLAVLGFPEAVAYFAAKHRPRAGQYLTSAMILAAPAGILAGTVGYFLLPLLISASNQPVLTAARVYLLIIPIFIVLSLPYSPLRGTGEFATWNLLRLAQPLLWLAVLMVFLCVGGAQPGAVAGVFLIGQFALVVPLAIITSRTLRGPFSPEPSMFGPLLAFGLPALLTTLPQTLNLRLDQLVMVGLVPSHQLGLYVVATAWSWILTPVTTAIGLVVLPRVAASDDQHAQREFLGRSSRLSLVVGISLAILVVLLTPVMLPLIFGSSFEGAIVSAIVLIPATVVFSHNYVIAEGLRGLGHPRAPLYAEGVGLGVTAVSLAILLPWLGIVGAALASLLSYTAVGTYQLRRLQRRIDCEIRQLLWPTLADVRFLVSRLLLQLSRFATYNPPSSRTGSTV